MSSSSSRHSLAYLLLLAAVVAPFSSGFVVSPQTRALPSSLVQLQAKKKKGKRGGKGFAKEDSKPAAPSTINNDNEPNDNAPTMNNSPSAETPFLQSVEQGGSTSIPRMEKSDSDLPPEERAKKLLRDQYGLRTLEEQRMEDKIQERKKKLEEMKATAEKEEDFDIMSMLPAPLIKGIDAFLKLGVGVCTVLFVLAGMGITLEAWSKATENPLPEDVDNFIATVVEPNFTPGLLVLLAFSVSLGGFAALQLSSSAATYKEK